MSQLTNYASDVFSVAPTMLQIFTSQAEYKTTTFPWSGGTQQRFTGCRFWQRSISPTQNKHQGKTTAQHLEIFTKLNIYFIWQDNSLCIRLNCTENGYERGKHILGHLSTLATLARPVKQVRKAKLDWGNWWAMGIEGWSKGAYEEPFFLPLKRPLRFTLTGIRSRLSTGVRFMQNL